MKKRMSTGIGIVLIALIGPTLAAAEIQSREQLFKILCIGDKSIGFDWENNEWVKAQFTPEKYLIEKLRIDDKSTPFCAMKAGDDKPFRTDDYALERGCYSVRTLGQKSYPTPAKLCLEEWKKSGEEWGLNSVSCHDSEYIQFKPEGAFILSMWSAPHDLDDDAQQKDSKSITVGRCGVM
jgi:hypothetical protein